MMENQGQRISGKTRLACGSARHGVYPLLAALNLHLTWSLLVPSTTTFTLSPQHPLMIHPAQCLPWRDVSRHWQAETWTHR